MILKFFCGIGIVYIMFYYIMEPDDTPFEAPFIGSIVGKGLLAMGILYCIVFISVFIVWMKMIKHARFGPFGLILFQMYS